MTDDIMWPNEAGKAFESLRGRTQEASPTFPELPVTTIPSIEASDYKQEIFDLLLSGWSPPKISKSVYKQYGVVIPPHDVANFLTLIPPSYLLPPSYLRTRLKQIDITIDAVGELGRLLVLQSERLDTSLLLEEVSKKPLPLTDRISKTYWKMLLDYIEKMQSLGDLPKEPAKIEAIAGGDSGLPRLKDLLEGDKGPNVHDGD